MSTFQRIEIRKERDFGEIISVTFEFIRKHIQALFRIALYIPGPMFLFGGVMMALYTYRINQVVTQQPNEPMQVFGLVWVMLLAVVFLGFGTMMLYLAVNEYLVLILNHPQHEPGFKDLWAAMKRSLGNYLGAAIILAIMVGVGFLFLIIPGIYLMVALTFVLIIISVEKKMFGDAIARSFSIIKGNWWSTFGLLLVLSILQMIITYTIMIPVWAVNWVSMLFLEMEQMNSVFFVVYTAASTVLYYVVAMFISIISYIAIAFKYFSIVEEKEEVGMQQKIMQMGTAGQV